MNEANRVDNQPETVLEEFASAGENMYLENANNSTPFLPKRDGFRAIRHGSHAFTW
jgi:hypothetical protein